MRVLVAEDVEDLAVAIAVGLRREGMAVDVVLDGVAALDHLDVTPYDVVVLDRDLPGMHGDDVCRRLMAGQSGTRVLMLTAASTVRDRVEGLGLGADDYLVKPFDLDELGARIRAVMRRHSGRAEPALAFGGVTLDPATRQVTQDGTPVLLSAREFAVLEALMQRPGALLSRAQLEDRLYGWGEEIESNAVSVYIHQLRRKLGAEFIQNVRGVGYFVGNTPKPTA
jgi:two-component system OmpR family response regulator/two-component system response regulator QseB